MKTRNIYIFDEYTSSQKNGIGTYLRELLYCLESPAYNVCLIIFNADTEEFNMVEDGAIRKFLFPGMKGHFLRQVHVMDKFLRLHIKDDPDNVFLVNHSPCEELLQSLKVYFPLSKTIFTIHDFGWTSRFMGDLEEFKVLLGEISSREEETEAGMLDPVVSYYKEEKGMYALADRTVCLCEDSRHILRSVYKLEWEKISFIPNGLHPIGKIQKAEKCIEEQRILLNIRSDEKILVAVGRPTRQKGIFDLIEAMKLVVKINKNVRFVIIGDSNEQSFRELIQAASPLATSITFTGLLDRDSTYNWLSIADMGVICSYYEQCSFVGIEMMMYGLPIIASDGLGIRNMFRDNGNARIARIGNRKYPEEYRNNLANAILELLSSPGLCQRLGVNARKTYEEKYHIRHMKQKYNELIRSL
ncbi:glycosyltransferase [Proteiniphilum sp.]|uniref:glycosyltransferase n=1 Tax=Proteiniphilum sp. TaxID=1926877 RepID=UPI00332E8040